MFRAGLVQKLSEVRKKGHREDSIDSMSSIKNILQEKKGIEMVADGM